MPVKIFMIAILFANYSFGQVKTVLDSLDDPIALTFVGDNVFLALHGRNPNQGKLVTFNINNPQESYRILFDSLIYPRAIIAKDSVIYLGLRDEIVTFKLSNTITKFDTLYHENALFPRSFAFHGDDLIYAHQNAISKIDISETNSESTFLFYFEDSPLSITNFNESIYIASGKSIHKYNPDTNTKSVIIKGLEYNIYSIMIKDDFIYLDQGNLSGFGEKILVYNLKNLALGSQTFCEDLNNVISLIEYNDKIYFANQIPSNVPQGKIQMIEKQLMVQPIENTINIYPNPTNNFLTIETLYINETRFYLYDTSGKLILSFYNEAYLDLMNFATGVYFLHYKNNKIMGTKKIIKIN